MRNLFDWYLALSGWRRSVVVEPTLQARLEYRHVLLPLVVRVC